MQIFTETKRRKEMKNMDRLRVIPDAAPHGYVTGWYLQERRRRFLFFWKWENVGWFDSYFDALIAKDIYIPKEASNAVKTIYVGASGNLFKI